MEQNPFLTTPVKMVLAGTVIILTGLLLIVVGNPFEKIATSVLTPASSSAPTPSLSPQINAVETSPDAKSILNAGDKAIPYEIIKDIADSNDACRDKKTIAPEDYSMDSRTIDLNNDNIGEIIVDAESICGEILVGGNYPENHAVYIYQKINGGWAKILEDNGAGVDVSEVKTNGYSDVSVGALLNHVLLTSSNNFYEWNNLKLKYEVIGNEVVNDGPANNDSGRVYDETDQELWNQYTSYKYGFEIKYPFTLAGYAGFTAEDTDYQKMPVKCPLNTEVWSDGKSNLGPEPSYEGKKITINGIAYCEYEAGEGAAGSIIKYFTFITVKDRKLYSLNFELSIIGDCTNYCESGNISDCKNDPVVLDCEKRKAQKLKSVNDSVSTFRFIK